jgi:hypothetical protein
MVAGSKGDGGYLSLVTNLGHEEGDEGYGESGQYS